ncbi:hypothetical protein TrVE_jg4938 [Triparma verrucosa]|uniref:ACB domain-containing protein n=1 Tax=Triparma verrucosa TaxID=1606542 RepID=A0A9W7FFJ1_9STRA|nr:hypothetical protein TrVE_jg4938 [Triparma verrucosa]
MPIDTFEDAVEAAKFIPSSTPTATKSKVYGLYKCATVGPRPSAARPSAWSTEARMKYDAWVAQNSKPMEVAKQDYIELIDQLLGKDSSSAMNMTEVELPTTNPDTPLSTVKTKKKLSIATSAASEATMNSFEQIQQLLKQLENEGKVMRKDVQQDIEQALKGLQSELANVKKSATKTTDYARQRINSVTDRVGFTFKFFSIAYLSRLGFAILLLLITGYLNALSSNLAGYRNPQIKITGPSWAKGMTTLPDLGHDVISKFTLRFLGTEYIDWFELPDHFVDWMGTFMVILILLSPRRFMILRRLPVVFSGLNLLRSFTVIMTSLPDASPECAKQFVRAGKGTSYKDRNFEEAVVKSFQRAWLLIIQPGKHITCGDMVFSGHTTFITLAMLVFAQYCYSAHPTKNKKLLACVRYCIYLIWFVGVIAIVGTKLHYTLDVFLAIFLTITTWNVYHDAIKYDALKQNYRVLKWLESEVIGEIDDEAFSNFQKKIQ